MTWFKGVLAFLVIAVSAVRGGRFRLRRGERDDIVHCPPGTSTTAMTMGISSSGPSGWSNRSAITLCLMCTAPGAMTRDEDDDNRNGASQFTQEVCTYYGDSNRVLTQKFECTNNELMRGISKDNSSLDSFLSCTKVDGRAEDNSVYETSFPPRSNRVARRNWQNWKMNVTCEHHRRRFMCGVRMVAPGAGEDYESHPKLDPICCASYQAYNRFNSSIYEYTIGPPDHGPAYRTSGSGAAVGILTFLVLLLLAGIILLVIHMFFCPILPASCVNSMQSYGQSKMNGAAASTFNSRPATAANGNGTMTNGTNGTTTNGISRPQTSTRRTSTVKPATNTG